jgi:hypothetical protein
MRGRGLGASGPRVMPITADRGVRRVGSHPFRPASNRPLTDCEKPGTEIRNPRPVGLQYGGRRHHPDRSPLPASETAQGTNNPPYDTKVFHCPGSRFPTSQRTAPPKLARVSRKWNPRSRQTLFGIPRGHISDSTSFDCHRLVPLLLITYLCCP